MRKTAAENQLASSNERFMRMALREAQRGAREGEVPVGAVVVRDGRVLARAHNRPIHLHDPSAHAEVLALRRAARKSLNYRLEGCDLYVTIEPCAMCAGAVVHSRLRRLIYGAQDSKAGACGSALRVLNHRKLNHRVETTRGILASECASVIQEFFRNKRSMKESEIRSQ
jgi:tRNA(adenine34) deaminase